VPIIVCREISKIDTQLTIACISVVGGAALQHCVRSIATTGLPGLIVADSEAITPEIRDIIESSAFEFIDGSGCSVPMKRALAVKHSTSEWIALVEDTCTLDDTWLSGCEAVLALNGASGASGPVNLGSHLDRRARALYCSDYGPFFPSNREASPNDDYASVVSVDTLPGVNLLYHRGTLIGYMNDEGLIESEVNRRMRENGHTLYIHKDLSVTLRYADTAGASFRSRFNHGRLYGGLQSRNLSVTARLGRGLACLLLPVVLSLRSLRALAGTREHIASTAPWILMFETVWSCGECTGYILGSGDSLADWK
jgi:hypothetical protein